MCQLLGMNCNTPTDIGFSFTGFRKRGGLTDHHTDGFGIAFFESVADSDNLEETTAPFSSKKTTKNSDNPPQKTGLRLFYDDKPSYLSPVADLVNHYPIKALNVIAHIRKATQGKTSLANTHPFVREVWGEQWAFAHNGQMNPAFIKGYQRLSSNGNAEFYQAVGDTDSEMAFCYLLNRLKSTFKKRPDDKTLFEFLTAQCRYLAANGLFNCLLSNGDWHLAYAGSLLFHLTRKAPFGEARLSDDDVTINFKELTQAHDKVTLMATIPLTENENWQQLAVNECVIFRHGDIVHQDRPSKRTYLSIEEGIALARSVGASA